MSSMVDVHKRSAIYLYCLSNSDREWLISHLKSEDQGKIIECINYLESIKVPKDRSFIQTLIDSVNEVNEKVLYEVLSRIVILQNESAVAFFEAEPAWICACVREECPGLMDNYVFSNLSKQKQNEIKKISKLVVNGYKSKIKKSVFSIVIDDMKKILEKSGNDKNELGFDFVMSKAV